MDISKLDPTLQGVIIGSVLSLAGNFLLQLLAFMGESFQWARKRKAEKEDAEARERRSEIEIIQNIYYNCTSRLSLLVSRKKDEVKLTDDEFVRIYTESVEWVTKLKLHQRDLYSDRHSGFRKWVDEFTQNGAYWSEHLLREINKVVVTDKMLFPGAKPSLERPGIKNIQMLMSDDFRREQMLDGVELPRSYTFSCDISELTAKQRDIIWSAYFEKNRSVPDSFVLEIPSFNESQKNINPRGIPWEGHVNPITSSPKQIFDAWEKDYMDGLDAAEKSKRLS